MITQNINILLADDDYADCLLFKDALEELPISASLTIVHNGEEVIKEITNKKKKLPDVLFLDLNMPRKNGFATLGEIKRSIDLQDLTVIIFSTSSDMQMVKQVYKDAAHYYICKPVDFLEMKKVIYEALSLLSKENTPMPHTENFMITGASVVIPDSIDS